LFLFEKINLYELGKMYNANNNSPNTILKPAPRAPYFGMNIKKRESTDIPFNN
jgi:hypothetical protein